jgi:hypothetical protein
LGSEGTSQRKRTVAAAAPASWARINPGASAGRIPAKVSLADRASVTAGYAKEVDAVNQYVPVRYAATANGTADERRRAQPQMIASNPNVAMNSLKKFAPACSYVPRCAEYRLAEHQMRRRHSGIEKFDIFHSGLALIFASQPQHFICHVEAVSFTLRAYPTRRKQYVNAAAGAEIQHGFAFMELRQCRGLPQPNEASTASSGRAPVCRAS